MTASFTPEAVERMADLLERRDYGEAQFLGVIAALRGYAQLLRQVEEVRKFADLLQGDIYEAVDPDSQRGSDMHIGTRLLAILNGKTGAQQG